MKPVGIDTETFLIRDGCPLPRMVSVQIYDPDDGDPVVYHSEFDRPAWKAHVRSLLQDPDVLLVGHNMAYDMGILANEAPELEGLIFDAYDNDRVTCTLIRQFLIYLAEGRARFDWKNGNRKPNFSLEEAASYALGLEFSKADSPRKSYSDLIYTPVEEWTDEEYSYAATDAVLPVKIYRQQGQFREAIVPYSYDDGRVVNEFPQARADFSLRLTSAWGMRTDADAVRGLRDRLETEVQAVIPGLVAAGVVREDGSRNIAAVRERLVAAYDGNPPLTDKGNELLDQGEDVDPADWASYAAEVLEDSGDQVLEDLASIMASRKELSTFIPILERGTEYPINTRYYVLAVTGRTRSRNPNVQNLPRRPGVRECFVPRDGYAYIFADYDSLEVRTWAQACLEIVGYSTAAENYLDNPHWDPHSYMGAAIAEKSYEWMMEMKKADCRHPSGSCEGAMLPQSEWCDPCTASDIRQLSKVPDFGLPGGMGAQSLVDFAAGYGREITLEKSRFLRDLWYDIYPEATPYFDYINRQVHDGGVCLQFGSNRQRGGCEYTEMANSMFQGSAADLAKTAMWQLTKECYTVEDSPLYGSRVVAFIHDEFGLEVPLDRVDEASNRLVEVMEWAGEQWLDIPVTADRAAMDHWSKKAKPIFNDAGELQVWS